MAKKVTGNWFQRNWRWLVPVYLVLLVGSHVVTDVLRLTEKEPAPPRSIMEVEGKRLAYLEWGREHRGRPLILLHGSPTGGASDFRHLGAALAAKGRWVIALDRWGWGSSEKWVEDYSFLSDANSVIGLMDQLGISQAHVGGWSYGAGPALILAERDPKRIRSATLIAGIGLQEGEGSGSHTIEHAKYSVAYPLVMGLGEVVPHFGLMGTRSDRHAFLRDFRDCDQRHLGTHLSLMKPPLLIVHGRKDPLVPAWVAQRHYEMRPQSRLVMLNASHFFLFDKDGQSLKTTVEEMRSFLAAADKGTAAPELGVRDETGWGDFRALWKGGLTLRGYKPFWAVGGAALIFAFFFPRSAAFIAGLGGGLLVFDFVLALVFAVLGGILKQREYIRRGMLALQLVGWGILGAVIGGGLLLVL